MSRLRAAAGALVRYPANRLRTVVIDACLLRIQQSQIGEVSCLTSETQGRWLSGNQDSAVAEQVGR
ncbi:hypothetical protein [Microbulbifer hainanensis]|uniref:hypothetical protein n=1 Tax=Microbulbifer hainanensis TaxID=2735675 RepID=UPI001866C55A|nr:hypothetical protein [Microbulbifer hainanensis]